MNDRGWIRQWLSVASVLLLIGGVVAALTSGGGRDDARLAVGPDPARAATSEPAASNRAAGDVRGAGVAQARPLEASTDAAAPALPPGTRVILWGDSLSWEATPAFHLAMAEVGARAESRAVGGTAPCDFLDDIRTTASAGRLDVAVIQFSGNVFTPCIQRSGALGSEEVVRQYEADVEAAVVALTGAGVRVVVAGAPPAQDPSREAWWERIRETQQAVAARHDGVTFVDVGSVLRGAAGYAREMPCAPWETAERGCVGGRIVVRGDDGVHFCPAPPHVPRGADGRCPVYSAGAFRFGIALADAATRGS